jgi:hypothetical protein
MNKSIRILLIVFVALVAVYFLFFRNTERVSTEKIDAKLFVADSTKIDKIEIVKNTESITLEKLNGVWNVTKPVNYLADTVAVYPMLSDLKNFMVESVASENQEKFNNYLDSVNNAHVSTYQEGKLLGTFIVGKDQSFGNTYIKKPDESRILLASKITGSNFTKPLKDYRNKLMLTLSSFGINKMEFKSTDSNKVDFTAVRDSVNKWSIAGDTVGSSLIEGTLNMLSNLNAEDFKDTTMTVFPEPTYTLTVYSTTGQTTVINLYEEAGSVPHSFICQVSGNPQLFRIFDGLAGQIMKKKKDFIP